MANILLSEAEKTYILHGVEVFKSNSTFAITYQLV